MLRLLGIVVSIGLADSLNPSTIAPALYFAAGRHPRRDVAEFTAGVFIVYLIGGLLIALGPGQLLLGLLPHPGPRLSYILELVAGAALLTCSAFLWRHREHLGRPRERRFNARGRSSAVVGATITAIELPTAFPYFAAIAAIVGSGYGVVHQIIFILIFNICFIAPLLGIMLVLTVAGPNAQRILGVGRRKLERHWPAVLSLVMLVAGLFIVALGATGLASLSHNRLGNAARKLHHFLHP